MVDVVKQRRKNIILVVVVVEVRGRLGRRKVALVVVLVVACTFLLVPFLRIIIGWLFLVAYLLPERVLFKEEESVGQG